MRQTVADVPTYEEIFRRDELPRAVRSLAALGYFERTLEAAGTGFLVADRPLLCDLGLFYVLYELAEDDNCGLAPAARFGVPLLDAFVERMAARPQIAAYLASPTRMPRYARAAGGASTYEYVAGRLNPEIIWREAREFIRIQSFKGIHCAHRALRLCFLGQFVHPLEPVVLDLTP